VESAEVRPAAYQPKRRVAHEEVLENHKIGFTSNQGCHEYLMIQNTFDSIVQLACSGYCNFSLNDHDYL
jgi:hypothetical protein